MSLLFVGNYFPQPQRSRQVCEELSTRLERSGWTILRTSFVKSRPLRLADMMQATWRRRRAYQAAHVSVFSGSAFTWAEATSWLLHRAGKPFVLTLHGGALPDFARREPDRVRRLLRGATEVVAPSRYLQETMRPFRDEIRLIPNPIEIDRYEFQPRSTPAPRLVWLRAFHEIYNPELAIRVLARLVKDVPDARLCMIGADTGDGRLDATRRTAEDLGLLDRVDFVGRVPKEAVPEWLQKGDIFLNTSNVDNTPVSVMEALACGLCVVSTKVGGIPYLIDDGTHALLVPPDDPEAMASAVLRVLEDPALAARLSRQGRERVESFSWNQVLPAWQTLFQDLVSARDVS